MLLLMLLPSRDFSYSFKPCTLMNESKRMYCKIKKMSIGPFSATLKTIKKNNIFMDKVLLDISRIAHLRGHLVAICLKTF